MQVLAVHPDPLLRQSTIQKMRREWAPMSPLARQNNVAALIREGQLEAGQAELAQLESDSIEIPLWLRTVLCHAMCQEKEFELLLHIFYDYHDRHIELPRPTWLYILHETLAAGHLPTTDWIWQKHVEPMYIMPDADCCIRTLTLAIREQHLQLADNALEVLESIAPEQAKHCRDTVESAYSATGKVRAKTPRSRSLYTVFGKSLRKTKAFYDPKEALEMRPLKRFLNPARQERKQKFESPESFSGR